jgi:hypothetical protein
VSLIVSHYDKPSKALVELPPLNAQLDLVRYDLAPAATGSAKRLAPHYLKHLEQSALGQLLCREERWTHLARSET